MRRNRINRVREPLRAQGPHYQLNNVPVREHLVIILRFLP